MEFTAEEKWILNHVAAGTDKNMCCHLLLLGALSLQEAEGTDLFLELYKKIEPIQGVQWEEIQESLPFDTILSGEQEEMEPAG